MAVEWINDDLTLKPGFEQNLPEDVRDYAKGFKSLPEALKAGVEARRDFRDRVKIPEDEAGKREVLKKHFGPILEADESARRKADEEAKAKAETDRVEAAKTALENAEKALKQRWDKDYDPNIELCRRAVRSEHVSGEIRSQIAKAAGVEPDKLTDDQIRSVVARDPMLADWLLTVGKLTRDGRTEKGGTTPNKDDERYPAFPYTPEVYADAPDSDPEKRWFMKRGAEYANGKYVGGYGGRG